MLTVIVMCVVTMGMKIMVAVLIMTNRKWITIAILMMKNVAGAEITDNYDDIVHSDKLKAD